MTSAVQPLFLAHPNGVDSIQFHWTEDRFDHLIQLGEANIACRSGREFEAWPMSPPIQQISIESIDGIDVALGVGCAGTSHWSLSVEPIDEGFRFDWACRTKQSPERLGTTYPKHAAVRIDPEQDSIRSAEGDEIRVEPGSELAGAETYRWRYTVLRV